MNRARRMVERFLGFQWRWEIAIVRAIETGRCITSLVSRMRAYPAEERKKLFGLAALALYLVTVAFFVWITAANWQGRDWFGINLMPQSQESVRSFAFRGLEFMPVRK